MIVHSNVESTSRKFLLLGVIAALLGVAEGAFGAHGLKGILSADMLIVFETGVRYQMYHAFALMITAMSVKQWGSDHPARFIVAGWCFVIGILLFSGSLFLLSVTGNASLGVITPIGGLAFLVGWGSLALALLGRRHPSKM